MRRVAVSASIVELPYGIEHAVLLRTGQMLIDRKTDDFAGVAIGDRKTPGWIAEMFQSLLLIQRDRIVDLGLDAMVEAILIERIARFGEQHVEMIDVPHVGTPRRHSQAFYPRKTLVVIGGVFDPPPGDFVGLADQPVADHGLYGVEP